MRATTTRALLMDAAERAIRYLETIDSRPVYPRARAIERLAEVLDAPRKGSS